MYRACLSCNGHLGGNSGIESFPVGRRLAYDLARGRLWVVCPHCDRWNLTALEERWEAMEECERLFRITKLRVSGENVSLAHPQEGPDLIRIGPAPKTEIAAWRYGRNFLDSRRKAPGLGAEGAVSVGDLIGAAGAYITAARTRFSSGTASARFLLTMRPLAVIDALQSPTGDRALIRYRHVASAELVRPAPDRAWGLRMQHERGEIELWGREGLATLGRLLAVTNSARATREQVSTALQKLEHASDPQSYFSRVAALVLRTSWGRDPAGSLPAPILTRSAPTAEKLALYLACRTFWAHGGTGSADQIPLLSLPVADRLALEMAVHEDTERRAFAGELEELEAAWREAEEIAEIADTLFQRQSVGRTVRDALGRGAGALVPA